VLRFDLRSQQTWPLIGVLALSLGGTAVAMRRIGRRRRVSERDNEGDPHQ
jgi:hypothetical protein